MIDIEAHYPTRDARRRCVIRIADEGVGLFIGKRQGAYGWHQVRRIDFEDPGRTKANVGAILVYGVLGMASRRGFTIITITTDSEDLHFESDVSIAEWRTGARRIPQAVPAAQGKVFVDGQPADGEPTAPTAPNKPTAAGWYPDPLGMPKLRWHDGASWTDHTADMPAAPGT